MPTIERTSQPEIDLIEIADFIARDNPIAAFRLLEQFDAKFAMLSRQPLIGEPRDDLAEGLRQFTAGGYVIFYLPQDAGVRIVGVLHGARNVDALF